MLAQDYNLITHQIIKCAIEVHRHFGPGLMESVYEICLYEELTRAGLYVERQKIIPVIYKGYELNKEFIIEKVYQAQSENPDELEKR